MLVGSFVDGWKGRGSERRAGSPGRGARERAAGSAVRLCDVGFAYPLFRVLERPSEPVWGGKEVAESIEDVLAAL